jgi:hypothetical protein
MRRRLMRTSLLTPILLALLFVAAGSAFGLPPDPNLWYQIKARHSAKCLDVSGGALRNGANVIQWDCHGGENQQWKFTPVGAGYYRITAKHSTKVLDVFGGIFSTANNVDVQQREYNGSANQMWYVEDLLNGYYRITARHSNKSLDIRGASTYNGAQAHQWDYVGGYNQMWELTPACGAADNVTSTFNGTVHMEIDNPNTPNPFDKNLNLAVDFTNCRASLRITRFTDISETFPVISQGIRLGDNTTTVRMTGGGSGNRNVTTGALEIPVTLHFQHTFPGAGPSDISLVLRTDRAAADGSVTLEGSGIFAGGFLHNSACRIRATGSFSPSP